MNNKSESLIQQECYIWFHNTYPSFRKLLFHVDNNSYNRKIGGDKKALGVVKGVSDLIFIFGGTCHCIEMKNAIGYQTEEQKIFQQRVEEQGVKYYICRSLEEFKDIINNIIEWKL